MMDVGAPVATRELSQQRSDGHREWTLTVRMFPVEPGHWPESCRVDVMPSCDKAVALLVLS